MSTTVLEALKNAQFNLKRVMPWCQHHISYAIGFEQLNNAIKALENGKGPYDVIQESILNDVDVGE